MEILKKLYADEAYRLSLISDNRGDYLHPVFGAGPNAPSVLLIGEAPGGEEAKQGCPFVGKAGRQLDELLERAGIDRNSVYVTNAVKFRPVNIKPRSVSNRTPTGKELKDSLLLLFRELSVLSPKVIVTLGNTPLKAVYSLSGAAAKTVGEVHGSVIPIVIEGGMYTLIPQYHPASVIYNRTLTDVLADDLMSLGRYIKENVSAK